MENYLLRLLTRPDKALADPEADRSPAQPLKALRESQEFDVITPLQIRQQFR